jgi:hypothetical protein
MAFTAIGFFGMLVIVWIADRTNQKDPPTRHDPKELGEMLRYSRQDLRLIAWLLAAILVMLGVVADRLH